MAISLKTRFQPSAGLQEQLARFGRGVFHRTRHGGFSRSWCSILLGCATLRRRYRWKMPDALQAAVATHHKLRLATRELMISARTLPLCSGSLHPLKQLRREQAANCANFAN